MYFFIIIQVELLHIDFDRVEVLVAELSAVVCSRCSHLFCGQVESCVESCSMSLSGHILRVLTLQAVSIVLLANGSNSAEVGLGRSL